MKAIIWLALFATVFASCNKNVAQTTEQRLEEILVKQVDNKTVFGAVVSIESPDFSWTSAKGNFETSSQYFIASTSKLYTSAVIFQLLDEGKLSLDDRISDYLDASIMDELHLLDGKDYSNEITINHLLSNTSGLPDYFEGKGGDGTKLVDELMGGNDDSWTFEECIAISKTMEPEFAPGAEGKALYSDTNFQLLGIIIEIITGISISEAYQTRIFEPLGLSQTFLYLDENDTRPKKMYYKKEELDIPKAMTSFKADGGIVSNASESMIFIRAFYNGGLFNEKHIEDGAVFNKIFYPNEYGVGYMRYKLPDFYNVPYFIGHSGLSGAFAWYCPEKDAYITGTVNQLNKPGTSYRMIIKMINEL
ncbi:MAG: serine hydrolase domain-containing protein [Bacteroidia bacterium]